MTEVKQTERSDRGRILHPVKRIGTSRLGSPIEMVLPADENPSLLVIAGQHGDEPETVSLLSSAIRCVPEGSLKAAVILAVNPDGILRGTRGNAAGVDLNRNFPVPNWGEGEILYRWTSKDPRDVRLSPGETPGSEPETAALLAVVEELRPQYVLSIHAPLACVDCPFASPLAVWLAERTGLELVPDVGYPTPGSFGTWARPRTVRVVTWELPHLALEELRLKYDDVLVQLLSGEPKEILCADATS